FVVLEPIGADALVGQHGALFFLRVPLRQRGRLELAKLCRLHCKTLRHPLFFWAQVGPAHILLLRSLGGAAVQGNRGSQRHQCYGLCHGGGLSKRRLPRCCGWRRRGSPTTLEPHPCWWCPNLSESRPSSWLCGGPPGPCRCRAL